MERRTYVQKNICLACYQGGKMFSEETSFLLGKSITKYLGNDKSTPKCLYKFTLLHLKTLLNTFLCHILRGPKNS